MNKVLIVCGPTATGKTALAAFLARKFSGQLISADSRQVYKGMDIVTGKDRPAGVIIHGLDLVQPNQDFSVAHFIEFARPLIKKLHHRNQLPIIVGGTGLYLKALTQPIDTINIKPNIKLRGQLAKLSLIKLQSKLKKTNINRFNQMNYSDQHNPRRLIRAIEVATSNSPQGSALQVTYNSLWIGLTAPKKTLDQRIKIRVNKRIKAGAIQEFNRLRKKYKKTLPSMSAIGYAQLSNIKAWVIAEQQYARRQLIWFNKFSQINWFDVSQPKFDQPVVNLIHSWYTKNNETK